MVKNPPPYAPRGEIGAYPLSYYLCSRVWDQPELYERIKRLHTFASISLKLQMQYSSLMAMSRDSNVIMKEDIIDGIKTEYRKEGKVTDPPIK